MQTQNNFRLLVVRLGAMGDILHALPAVTALRHAHPDWVIDWIVEPRWRALLAADGTCPSGAKQAAEKLGDPGKIGRKRTSVAKAIVDSIGFIRGLKPLSPSESSFSAACKAQADFGAFTARLNSHPIDEDLSMGAPGKSCPDTSAGKEQNCSVAGEGMPLQDGRNAAQPLVDHLHFAATKEWRKAPFSRQTLHEFKALRVALKSAEYDAVIDLQGAIRSALLACLAAKLAGCRRVIGEAFPREMPARWLFTERVATRGTHVIEQDVELVSAIVGDALKPVAPLLPMDTAAEAWADAILPPAVKQKAVLINPGAGWGAKRWPVERYAIVAQGLIERGCRVLVNVGPGEEPLAEVIVSTTGGAATALSCSLAQLIALTRRISLAVAGDTGPLHLACALGKPVVGIYGPTDPSRNGPYGTNFKVLRCPASRRDHTRYEAPEAGLLTILQEDVLHAADALLYSETASKSAL